MNPIIVTQEPDFFFRRFEDAFPDWAPVFPALFALTALLLILFFRQEESVAEMCRRAGIPPSLIGLSAGMWVLGAFLGVALLGLFVLVGMIINPFGALFLTMGLQEWAFLLALWVALIVFAVRNPTAWIGVVVLGAGLGLLGLLCLFGLDFPLIVALTVMTVRVMAVVFYLAFVRRSEPVHPAWFAGLPLVYAVTGVTLFPLWLALFVAVMICTRSLTALLIGATAEVCAAIYLAVVYLVLAPVYGTHPGFGWFLVLTPMLLTGLVYIASMYAREAHSRMALVVFGGFVWAYAGYLATGLVYLWPEFVRNPGIAVLFSLAPHLAFGFLALMCTVFRREGQRLPVEMAAFLAFLRLTVYGYLAFFFMLLAMQYYDTTETHSKVLVLFDVSASMNHVDDFPAPGQDPRTLPSRQDKVVAFLTAAGGPNDPLSFMDRLQEKSPATCYRFGGVLDDFDFHVQQFAGGRKLGKEGWDAWLKPDRQKLEVPETVGGKALNEEDRKRLALKLQNLYEDLTTGTNVTGSALQAAVREAGSMLQAIIIVSDGQSNLGSDETFRELVSRAQNSKRPIHLITVGVGQYKQAVAIRIQDIQAPQQARPDDKFPVRVPVVGDGLPDEPFTVHLDATRVVKKGESWVPLAGEKKTLTAEGKFVAKGEHPFGEVEFKIDVRALRGIESADDSKDDLVEGTWEFTARVPRHARESFAEAEHVSKRPARVVVQKRKLRVLLVAGGPSRDYQFLRTLFYREVQEKRLELSVFLQTAGTENVDQDVEADRLLTHFPDRLGLDANRDPHSSLSEYDVIVAFDPDWSLFSNEQIKLLQRWVGGPSAGGLIVVGGPVHSFQLARKSAGDVDLGPLLTIMPVILKDSRLHGLGIGHDPSRPYPLNFPKNAGEFDFLKIEDEGEAPLSGWEKFFWDSEAPEPGKDQRPRRGFYNYYPVEKTRPDTQVVATFAGEEGSRINDGKDEQPFLATMRYAGGRTVWIGAGEMWRLRTAPHGEAYHQRFWVKLARFAASGNIEKLAQHGRILAASTATTGVVPVEAQVLGEDLEPLKRDARPVVQVIRHGEADDKGDRDTPARFDLKARSTEGEWNGWFSGKFKVRTPGDYTLKITIPGVAEPLTHSITIEKPNPETDNTRPNHEHLYQVATSAQPILNRLKENERAELLRILRPPVGEELKEEGAGEGKEQARLYFPLQQAHVIPSYLSKIDPTRNSVKGRVQDLWDRPLWESGEFRMRADWFIVLVSLVVGSVAFGILAFIRRFVLSAVVLGCAALLSLGILGLNLIVPDLPWEYMALDMSWALALVVGLLCVEWLIRKLLKLA